MSGPKKANRMPKKAKPADFTGNPATRRRTPANKPFTFTGSLYRKDDPFAKEKEVQKDLASDRAVTFNRRRWEDRQRRRDEQARREAEDYDFRHWKANTGGGIMWRRDPKRGSDRWNKRAISRRMWDNHEHVALWRDNWRFRDPHMNEWGNAWGPQQYGNPLFGPNRDQNLHRLKPLSKDAGKRATRKNCPIPAYWENRGPLIQKLWNNWCWRQKDLEREGRGPGELTDAEMEKVVKRAYDRAKNPEKYDEEETRKIEKLVKDLEEEIKEQKRIKGPADFQFPREWFEYAEAMVLQQYIAEQQYREFSQPPRATAQGQRPRPDSPTGLRDPWTGVEGRPTTTPHSPKGRGKKCSPDAQKKGMCAMMGGRRRKRATRRRTRRHKRKRRISRRRRRRKRRRTRRRR